MIIAQQLNAELQIIATVKENLQPKPAWTEKAVEGLLSNILNPPLNTPEEQSYLKKSAFQNPFLIKFLQKIFAVRQGKLMLQ